MPFEVDLLDHGYLKHIESWGSDERIIESARMSTNKGFQGWGQNHCKRCGLAEQAAMTVPTCMDKVPHEWEYVAKDEKLLTYLYEHKHLTPFEMCGLTIEVQAPIFVFREWHRHRTQSYNELSARYTELPNLFYIPDNERLMAAKQSKKNKQGSEDGFTLDEAENLANTLLTHMAYCRTLYESLLIAGVSREVARIVIPVAQYSRMRASANLRNWLAFLTLRMDPAAQYEIRAYANVVGDLIKQEFPRVWGLFDGAK
jgi:thymidylate synthase (FAD)